MNYKILVLIVLIIISSVFSDNCYWKPNKELSPYFNGYIKTWNNGKPITNNCDQTCCCQFNEGKPFDNCINYIDHRRCNRLNQCIKCNIKV